MRVFESRSRSKSTTFGPVLSGITCKTRVRESNVSLKSMGIIVFPAKSVTVPSSRRI